MVVWKTREQMTQCKLLFRVAILRLKAQGSGMKEQMENEMETGGFIRISKVILRFRVGLFFVAIRTHCSVP